MTDRVPYEYIGDYNELLYLRARFYAPGIGRFITKDTWEGNDQAPLSLNSWNYVYSNPVNFSDPSGHCAGTIGLDAEIKTVMQFTAPHFLNGQSWQATGAAWKKAWNTCVNSLQKASNSFSNRDYGRALLYATGIAASSHAIGDRINQINHEMDILWCKDASWSEWMVAALDVGGWSLGVSSLMAPFAYEGWLAAKGAFGEAVFGSLGRFEYFDDMLYPSMAHDGYYASPFTISESSYVRRLIIDWKGASPEERIMIQQELNRISASRAGNSLSNLGIRPEELPQGVNCAECVNIVNTFNGKPTNLLFGGRNDNSLSTRLVNDMYMIPAAEAVPGDTISFYGSYSYPSQGLDGIVSRSTIPNYTYHVGINAGDGYIFSKLGLPGPFTTLTLEEVAWLYPNTSAQFWTIP